MSIVAIIPARGGSKRIPKKNIKTFCGKPIIAYSIEAALSAGIFDEVMVSTDSEEIKGISEKYGASVPFFRSTEASSDYATTADVIREVLDVYEKRGKSFGFFACIYPTAPFVTGEKLRKAVRLLDNSDAVISVVRYSYPPQRAFVLQNENVVYQYPGYEKTRSQDLPAIYHDCGQFYFCNSETFKRHHSLLLPNTKPYIIQELESQDIDTLSDWRIAEMKYKLIESQEDSNG